MADDTLHSLWQHHYQKYLIHKRWWLIEALEIQITHINIYYYLTQQKCTFVSVIFTSQVFNQNILNIIKRWLLNISTITKHTSRMTVIARPVPCYINYIEYVCIRFQSEFKIYHKVHVCGVDYIKKIYKQNLTMVKNTYIRGH